MRFQAYLATSAVGIAALVASSIVGPAHAALLNGDLTVVGSGDTEGASFDTATKLDFGTFGTSGGNGFGNPGSFLVLTAEGDLASLFFNVGTIQDLTIAPPNVPLTGFLSVGGFSFDLVALNLVSQTIHNIVLGGTGLINWIGFDPTPGIFTLSADAGSTRFSFSAGAHAVPEPGTLGLIGLGLIAVSVALRRRRAAFQEDHQAV